MISEQPRLAWVSQGAALELPCEAASPEGWPADLRIDSEVPADALSATADSPDTSSPDAVSAEGAAWGNSIPTSIQPPSALPQEHSLAVILQRPWSGGASNAASTGTGLLLASRTATTPESAVSGGVLFRLASGIALLGLALWLAVRRPSDAAIAWRWPGRPGTSPCGRDVLWLGLAGVAWLTGGPWSLAPLFAVVGLFFLLQRAAKLGFLPRFA